MRNEDCIYVRVFFEEDAGEQLLSPVLISI